MPYLKKPCLSEARLFWGAVTSKTRATESQKQIPCGNDNKKGNGKNAGKSKGVVVESVHSPGSAESI